MKDNAVSVVSAIVPAYNEEETIGLVVQNLVSHPLIAEVIVVSDGSVDATASKALEAGAIVIELNENRGKGEAMEIGVKKACGDILLFADADLLGLTHVMITQLVRYVQSGEFDMFTLVRDRASETFQLYLSADYVVGGERALKKNLWESVPQEDRRGFGVELALNYYARQQGMNIGHELAPGLDQVSKERKRGLFLGLWMRLMMVAECTYTFLKLYFFRKRTMISASA